MRRGCSFRVSVSPKWRRIKRHLPEAEIKVKQEVRLILVDIKKRESDQEETRFFSCACVQTENYSLDRLQGLV